MTNAIQTTAAQAGTSGATLVQAQSNSALGKDQFLKLLMTQLQQQDPLNPMDNQAFVAQLAQFANLELQQAANASLEGIMLAQASNSQTAAVGLVGKDVSYRGDSVHLSAGSPVTVGGRLSGEAGEVTLTVTDASGKTVRTLKLGPRPSGGLSVEWDGRDDSGEPCPPGEYRARLVAADLQGKNVAVEQALKGRVEGVSFENGYPELLVGSARLKLGDVLDVRAPPASQTSSTSSSSNTTSSTGGAP